MPPLAIRVQVLPTRRAAALLPVPVQPPPAACSRMAVRAAGAHPSVQLIATDVDGTLLNHRQELTPRVEEAVKRARDAGVPVRKERGSGERAP